MGFIIVEECIVEELDKTQESEVVKIMSNSFSQLQTLQLLLSNKLAPLPEKENASSSSRPTPADVRQTFRHIYRSGEGDITLLYIQLQVICSDLFAGSCTSATMGMASSAMNAVAKVIEVTPIGVY
ncbi:uncharacterized protein LOC116016938 isoform X2 [Ipomoea triloba]|uniref:uncharacterized protein LOC116016938 isoform X2 n=1 Tax=Ipomoea triloba TaxID=35885 RepID=UPI00125E3765|nr:uncharacterized protein LOC116016938 isoform X2 [Ipomoea triloba]